MGKQIHTVLADVNQVNMLTEDDFEGVDADELDTKHLRSLMQDAESLKRKAQGGALLILLSETTDIFPKEKGRRAEESKSCS